VLHAKGFALSQLHSDLAYLKGDVLNSSNNNNNNNKNHNNINKSHNNYIKEASTRGFAQSLHAQELQGLLRRCSSPAPLGISQGIYVIF
jgi:hypothetical protein